MHPRSHLAKLAVAGLVAVGFVSKSGCFTWPLEQEESRPPVVTNESVDRLRDLVGRFDIVQRDDGGNLVVPAEILGLKKGAEVTIKGNELRSGDKLLATLTTDFSATGLDLDKQVHVHRRPVMLTLPNGKGLLCAYELFGERGGFTLVYPHTMGRVSGGTWLYLARIAE